MLEPPFPHPPRVAGRYQLRFYRDGDMKALLIFAGCYAARKMCDACLADLSWDYVGDERLETTDGKIRIWSNLLHEVMDHKYSAEENGWELPRPYPSYARMIREDNWREPAVVADGDAQAASLGRRSVTRKAARATAPDGEAKSSGTTPAKASVPRASRAGLVTIQDICASLGVEPRDARVALRKSKVEKPASGGWAWAAGDAMIEKVKLIIKAGAKK